MISWTLGNPGDSFTIWGINVLLQATVVTTVALAIGLGLRHAAVLRHGVLLAGLALILLTPLTAGVVQLSGRGWLSLPIAPEAAGPVTNTGRTAELGAESAWAGPSKKLDLTAGVVGEDRDQFAYGSFDLAHGRQLGPRADERPPFNDPKGNTSPESQPQSVNPRPITVSSRTMLRVAVGAMFAIWLAGSALLLARLAIGCFGLARILDTARPNLDAAVNESFAQAGRAMQLQKLPELVFSDRVSEPCSAGLIRPRIVLPQRMAGRVTPQQLRDILLHEAAHVVRHDPAIVLLQNVAAALFWLHPLVKTLNRQLAQAREEVCDNYVLTATDAPSYSRTLLMLGQSVRLHSALPGAVGLFTSRWKLERRVAGLLDARRNRGTRLSQSGWAFVSIVALALAGILPLGTISMAVHAEDSRPRAGADVPAQKATAPNRVTEVAEPIEVTTTAEETVDDGSLSLHLTVRMPDGSPAAGAIVESLHQQPELERTVRADDRGKVTIREAFGNGCQIYARSPDGRFQAIFRETAAHARTTLAEPQTLTLAPSLSHRVSITSEGKPVAEAQVVVVGHFFHIQGQTDSHGVAVLQIPADDKIRGVAAWHPELGIAGVHDWNRESWPEAIELPLLAPAPLTIRAVDPQGAPVPGLDLSLSMRTADGDWILASHFPAALVRTNEQGETRIAWAPAENLKYVDVEILGSSWKIDERDLKRLSQRVVTIEVRRQKPVEGRLIMPEGRSAEGILIAGFGFGPGSTGDVPQIRARRDGRFVFTAPSNHGYILGLSDWEWAAEPWTGVILTSDDTEPAQIAIPVVRAIPITVEVTRGSQRKPLAAAWVYVQQRRDFQWTEAGGEEQNASGSVGGWLRTDAQGRVQGGVAKGKIDVRVSSGQWNETREIEVTSDEPIDVQFHRPWSGNRHVVARMTRDGAPFQPSANSTALTWTKKDKGSVDPIHHPIIRDDRTIAVDFDQETMELLAIDREQKLSGFVRVGLDDDAVELVMEPLATYSGTVLDEDGQPMVGRMMKLTTGTSFQDVVDPERTDDAGRFRFTRVAVSVPLRLWIEDEEGLPKYFLFDTNRLFEPGEVREGGPVRPLRMGDDGETLRSTKASPPLPLAERLQETCEKVRVAGMHALVILQGDKSANVANLTDRVTDYENDSALAYLPVIVTTDQLEAEAALVAERHWDRPQAGEVTLIALDGHQKPLATQTIGGADSLASRAQAEKFLANHKPKFEDAREKLNRGRKEASRDGKRVLLIVGGPRCGPCFRLGRWIDRQHELLEKDYVIVKVMENLEERAHEISEEIGGANQGIPWFVITEPDGKILMTSAGPTGNMGMPSSTEDLRHFREMLEQTALRISDKEIGELIETLSPPQ
jgi:beta-lactamase regulating signal transducer with metallopeptidase domain